MEFFRIEPVRVIKKVGNSCEGSKTHLDTLKQLLKTQKNAFLHAGYPFFEPSVDPIDKEL